MEVRQTDRYVQINVGGRHRQKSGNQRAKSIGKVKGNIGEWKMKKDA